MKPTAAAISALSELIELGISSRGAFESTWAEEARTSDEAVGATRPDGAITPGAVRTLEISEMSEMSETSERKDGALEEDKKSERKDGAPEQGEVDAEETPGTADEPTPGDRLLALVSWAFGRGLARFWTCQVNGGPDRLRRFMTQNVHERRDELRMRVRNALSRLAALEEWGVDASLFDSTAPPGSPLNIPFYQQLWRAFTEPDPSNLERGHLIPLDPFTRFHVERYYLLAYLEALDSAAGGRIRAEINDIGQCRRGVVRSVLLRDLVGWTKRHVFGNFEAFRRAPGERLPFLPLEDLFVEPLATLENDETLYPVRELLKDLLRSYSIVVVEAPSGSGKSLTARMLASAWARDHLEENEGSRYLDFPVFIPCADIRPGLRRDLSRARGQQPSDAQRARAEQVSGSSDGTIDDMQEGGFGRNDALSALGATQNVHGGFPGFDVIVRCAWQAQVAGLGPVLPLDDDVFSPLEPEQRAVFLLDGLEEMFDPETAVVSLLRQVREFQSERHRFVLFAQPGLLPSGARLEELGIRRVELLPFTTVDDEGAPGGQVREWLERWCRLTGGEAASMARPGDSSSRNRLTGGEAALTLEALETRGLLELATRPLLLLMIAQTWKKPALRPLIDGMTAPDVPAARSSADPTQKGQMRQPGWAYAVPLFEAFFRQVINSRLEPADRGPFEQPNACTAARGSVLKEAFIGRKGLDGAIGETETALWCLSRVAWEALRLEQRDVPRWLTSHHIQHVLEEDAPEVVSMTDAASRTDVICAFSGSLLRLEQAAPGAPSARILFGHRTFRAFLVARYWADRLKHIVEERSAYERRRLTRDLMGARLLAEGEESFPFLMQIINGDLRSDAYRARSVGSTDPDPDPPGCDNNAPLCWTDDDRMRLVDWAQTCFEEEAIVPSGGELSFVNDSQQVLRETALAIGSGVKASPGLEARNGRSLSVMLAWFWLRRKQPRILARGAKLRGAVLWRGQLRWADFRDADLSGADLEGVDLRDAILGGANLEAAGLREARIERVDLKGSRLVRANLDKADLRGADLSGAVLDEASLEEADLRGANLAEASLRCANLEGANVAGADLSGTDLEGAALVAAVFGGASWDDATRWPAGFDPRAAGVLSEP